MRWDTRRSPGLGLKGIEWGTAVSSGAAALLGTAMLLSLSGCVKMPESNARTVPAEFPVAEPPPLAFMDHGLGDDSVVRIVTPYVACSGTLIAKDRVLTAHHCLAERESSGEYLHVDVDPRDVRVQLGGDYLPWGEVGVRAIVAPECGWAAGVGDIAVLVLDSSIADVPWKEVRLDRPPRPGAEVRPVGFGRCEDSAQGIRLRTRKGGKIESVEVTSFQLQAAICPGDSGGPGVTSGGAVVGVVSASALDGRQATKKRTEFTRVDRWQEVFANALKISEGANPAELPPIPGCPDE